MAESDTKPDTGSKRTPSASAVQRDAHTELRPAGARPQPRSKVLPPELRDEPGDDDLFNDMPV